MNLRFPLFLLFLATIVFNSYGQSGPSSLVVHELHKLQNPTRVLYLAAHPDDENTKMISYMANEVGATTAYLSLTRGDGGQNLIGTELSAKLGVLRTQELMQARSIDGGQQFFTRAVDFGYSKNANETFKKWGKEEILADVVWVIRSFRPDVIITRFPPDSRGGHGHHTASAMLGIEAFELAANAEAFPEQLEYVDTWQTTRIYWNASVWWNKGLDTIAAKDPAYVSLDVGGYNTAIGMSSNELASLSRTQHKSQGFGVRVDRGSQKEYLMYLAGDTAEADILDGIYQSWQRYGFTEGNHLIQVLIDTYDATYPYRSLPKLWDLKEQAEAISDEDLRRSFRQKVDDIILAVCGWHGEAVVQQNFMKPGSKQEVELQLINRSPAKINLVSAKVGQESFELNEGLMMNELLKQKLIHQNGTDDISQPYWLIQPYQNLYDVEDQELVGKPENDPSIMVQLTLSIDDHIITTKVPVTYKFSDRVDGEIIRPAFVVPNITAYSEASQLLFLDNEAQEVSFTFDFLEPIQAEVHLEAKGFKLSQNKFEIGGKDESSLVNTIAFTVKPKNGVSESYLKISVDGKELQSLRLIDYPHIQQRMVLEDAGISLTTINLKKEGDLIGYIPGAGDEVAEAIEQMGYKVVLLDEKMIRSGNLNQYKTIVAGIRAYNTCEWLPSVKAQLMKYVEDGGNYIVQYNTASRDLLSEDLGPYSFKLTRNRVTEEDAEVSFLLPNHRIFSKPNKITSADFDGWVQERGLYFAGDFEQNYEAPIGWHDEGEDMQPGGLIIANYGKGTFMYTGISFFRELPAGVPGAYRLLANLLSYTNTSSNE